MSKPDDLELPTVHATGTAACSAHAALFPRWHERGAQERLSRDLGRVLEALSRPTDAPPSEGE